MARGATLRGMLPRAATLTLATLVLAACAGGESSVSKDMSEQLDRADTPPPAGLSLTGFPLDRLDFAHNPVEALDPPASLSAADLKARGVQSHRALTATTPRVWLFVFEFADQGDLFAALEDPKLLLPEAPPYDLAAAFTGRWLLITGFPSDKPVSPEMEAARTMFLARFAGDE